MIISDEQVRRAAEYLRACRDTVSRASGPLHIEGDVLARAVEAALSAPEIRHERVAQAAYVGEGYLPDPESVAAKLLGRVLSDSIR